MEMTLKMKINEIKTREQKSALNKWAANNFVGSIIAGTGFGKSRCAVLACKYVIDNNIRAKSLILVPTVQLQDQFKEEFNKWDCSNYLDNVDILCYQSAYKLQGQKYELVICDEIHLGLSPKYRKFFSHNFYDKLLCMTATVPEHDEYKELLKDMAPTVYSISLDKCVELGIVSPYNIYCIPVQLTDKERRLQSYK